MEDLIKRLEAAEVGSRELDALIWCAFRPERIKLLGTSIPYGDQSGRTQVRFSLPPKRMEIVTNDKTAFPHATPVTTSLDAALALAERVGWRAYMADFSIVNNFSWMLKSLSDISVTCTESGEHYTGPDFKSGRGKTPSLALCIAILRAKQIDTASNPR